MEQGRWRGKKLGLAISHIDSDQRTFEEPNQNKTGSFASDVINPVGIESLIFSAAELGDTTMLTNDSLKMFSVNANLAPNGGSASSMLFPLVQGIGFITAVYSGLTPMAQSSVGILSVSEAGAPGYWNIQVPDHHAGPEVVAAVCATLGHND